LIVHFNLAGIAVFIAKFTASLARLFQPQDDPAALGHIASKYPGEFERQANHNYANQDHPAASKPQFAKIISLQPARKLVAAFTTLIATRLTKDGHHNDLPSPSLNFRSFEKLLYFISLPR
jgi:hypothetical protein